MVFAKPFREGMESFGSGVHEFAFRGAHRGLQTAPLLNAGGVGASVLADALSARGPSTWRFELENRL